MFIEKRAETPAALIDVSVYMVVCKVSYDNERGKHLQNVSTAIL
jgi:hypothetical protein